MILGDGFKYDILTGEQGPSCTTVSQIPNLKLIHVRFLKSSRSSQNDETYSPIDDGSDDDGNSIFKEPSKGIKRSFTKSDG